jgi:hypothetical protein
MVIGYAQSKKRYEFVIFEYTESKSYVNEIKFGKSNIQLYHPFGKQQS